MKVANYPDNEWPTIRIMMEPSIGIWKVADYTDMEGGQLYGYGRWPTIRKWKVANYTDMEGGQLYGYGRWPTIWIMKVAN